MKRSTIKAMMVMIFSWLIVLVLNVHASEESPSNLVCASEKACDPKVTSGKFFLMKSVCEELLKKGIGGSFLGVPDCDIQWFDEPFSNTLPELLYDRGSILAFLSQYGNVGKNRKKLLTDVSVAD